MQEQEIKTGYPLDWPIGSRRTPPDRRVYGQFKQTADTSRRFLLSELSRLGASGVVISSNVPLKSDGQMRSDYAARSLRMDEDPGVAVYFTLKGKSRVICCDRYNAVWKNVYAIALAVEAMRGIERWGVTDFIDRAFEGFTKLLTTPYQDPWIILEIPIGSSEKDIDQAFKAKARHLHPDNGGTAHQFQDLQWARDEAKRLIGVK
jgi:hypothetical protein